MKIFLNHNDENIIQTEIVCENEDISILHKVNVKNYSDYLITKFKMYSRNSISFILDISKLNNISESEFPESYNSAMVKEKIKVEYREIANKYSLNVVVEF